VANRHALLIGVPHYDDDEFNEPRLAGAVRSDVAAMRAALAQSDYEVSDCGITDAERGGATLNRLNQSIEAACANVPPGGVLLIYFSGHGLTVNGRDYLVPSDSYRPRSSQPADRADARQPDARGPGAGRTDGGGLAAPAVRSLVPVVPDPDVLAACRAALVVFFVDACRSEPTENEPATDGQVQAARSVEPGGQLPFLADGGHFVLVMGSGAGQACQYDESGSAFTQALAQVLDHRHPARTLRDVWDAVTTDMDRRSRQYQGTEQLPVVRYPEVLELAGGTGICEGDELTAAWRKAVEAPLAELCADPRLADRVRSVVEECARRCGAAAQKLHERTDLADPWTDQNYPGRVVQHIQVLLGDSIDLRPGEAAMLIAAPFLREGVLAEGLRDAAGVDPANLSRTYEPGPRSDLELTHEMHQHLVQRATGLRQSGLTEAGDQLAMWLVHQWLAGRARLWDEAGALSVYALSRDLIEGYQGTADADEVPKLVQTLLLAIGAAPVDERLLGRLDTSYVDDRWRGVAAVLWLAGIMAADLRRLPPVVADLVGTRMELPLADVQDAAGRRARWQPQADGSDLDLRLACDHPALHAAFESMVHRADTTRETIEARLRVPAAFAKQLPRRFTAAGLRPVTSANDEPAYEVPLSRFQIAEEKVRELLMGKQLYGDPALAIRELYQNALDACRWRQTRHDYLTRTNMRPASWEGLIRFEQGIDADGRSFIECEDNGVGMDINTLKHVFANAGERFVYGQEFRAEQADWADLVPPLRMVSNSQFGLGVFSYFMLADEITVLTRHERGNGVVDGQAYEVRIASSGSLFQINPADGLIGGGTRIRLYLSGDEVGVSVLATLRDLLLIAEHRVEVNGPDDRETWLPGELRYPTGSVRPLKCGDDLWWVPGGGGLAADGIKTIFDARTGLYVEDKEARRFFGLVANLRGEHRPRFTVDRETLLSWDEDWVAGQIDAALPALMEWPGFNLPWLWDLAEADIARAQRVFEHAIGAAKHFQTGKGEGLPAPIPLSVVGCLPRDRKILGGRFRERDVPYWLGGWRAGIWRSLGQHVSVDAMEPGDRAYVVPRRTDGFPVPHVIDGALLDSAAENHRYRDRLSGDDLMAIVAVTGCTRRVALRRLRRYAIAGLDLSPCRLVPATDIAEESRAAGLVVALVETRRDDPATRSLAASSIRAVDTDLELLQALAPWPPAGQPQARDLLVALLRATIRFKRPIAEVADHAQRLAAGRWSGPVPDLARLVADSLPEADRIVEAFGINTVMNWLERGEARASTLARASDRLLWPLGQVLDLCDGLAPVGVRIPGREAYPRELNNIEGAALRRVNAMGQPLTSLDMVRIARDARESVGAAHRALEGLEQRGLLVRPVLTGPSEFVPTRQEIDFVDDRVAAPRVSPRHRPTLSRNAGDWGRAPWWRIAQMVALDRESDEPLLPIARNLIPFTAPTAPITSPELVEFAYRLNATLAGAVDQLHAIYPAAEVPALVPGCERLTVSWAVADALLSAEAARISWRLDPRSVIEAALGTERPLGDFLGQLDPFRRLGAPVPPYDEGIGDALNKLVIDDYDLDMLAPMNVEGRKEARHAINALALVAIAGRLGLTLAEVQQRLARLQPVGLVLDYPQVDLPDEIVYWHDLLALTPYFDGQAPAVSGRIDRAYLEQAAEEIFDATPDEIPAKADFLRQRLAVYAPLFELELPEEDSVA
jgi:HAMP domain-containing protein